MKKKLVEDNKDISYILTMALGNKYKLYYKHTNNPIQKMSYFLPDLIITENFVRQKAAAEIIKEIRIEHRFSNIPVYYFLLNRILKN